MRLVKPRGLFALSLSAMSVAISLLGSGCASESATPVQPTRRPGIDVPTISSTWPAAPVLTPTVTPSRESARPDPFDFRPFVLKIEEAVRRRDVDAIVVVTKETEIDCREVKQLGPECPPESLGKVRRGIPIGPWGSEYALTSDEEYRVFLTKFFAENEPRVTDKYGAGEPRLLGIGRSGYVQKFRDAVVTAIGPDGRVALLLRSEYREAGWSIVAVVAAGSGFVDEIVGSKSPEYSVTLWPPPDEIASPQGAANQPTPTPQSEVREYTSQTYRISLRYPANWKKVDGYEERYEGAGGFFQLNAMNGGSLEQVCESEAYHKLKPYGSEPRIEQVQVHGLDARIIYPSKDQSMPGQSALIVTYPETVEIRGQACRYFVLWADKEHLRKLVEQLTFIPPTRRK
ncbi:MAG: hypothetical protein ABIH46_01725 [Chloroflexota bacterium]